MSVAWAIARRELGAFARTPGGWLVCALYLVLSGVVFGFGTLRPGEPASMRDFFTLSNWLLMFLCPAVSMRVYAEEYRSGTYEALATAAASDWSIAAGKMAGAALSLLWMLAPTVVFAGALLAISDAPWGPIAAGYAGLALCGAFYVAIGTAWSALTPSQIAAYLGSLFTILLLRIASERGPSALGERRGAWLSALSVESRMADFGRGVIDSGHVAFFVAGAAALTALTAAIVGARRLR